MRDDVVAQEEVREHVHGVLQEVSLRPLRDLRQPGRVPLLRPLEEPRRTIQVPLS